METRGKNEWRCQACQKLLGVLTKDGLLHIRVSQRYDVFASLPAIAVCGACRTRSTLRAGGAQETLRGA